MNSSLIAKNIVRAIFAKTPLNMNSSEREQLQNSCEQNLHAIGKAISAYRADHNDDMPDWLAALYPKIPIRSGIATMPC